MSEGGNSGKTAGISIGWVIFIAIVVVLFLTQGERNANPTPCEPDGYGICRP